MLSRPRPKLVLAVLVPLAVAACTSTTPSTAPSAPPVTQAESATPSPSASPTPSETTSPSAKPVARTKDQLAKALLASDDVPAGFSKEKAGSTKEAGVSVKGTGKSCQALAKLLEAEQIAGSTASATVSFSGGADGPSVDESLDAMGTAAAARAVIDDFGDAVEDCKTLSLTFEGAGTSPLTVRKVAFGKIGNRSVAVRFTASSGPLEGFELIQLGAHVDDVLLGMTFFGLEASGAEEAAGDAVSKIKKKLDFETI